MRKSETMAAKTTLPTKAFGIMVTMLRNISLSDIGTHGGCEGWITAHDAGTESLHGHKRGTGSLYRVNSGDEVAEGR